MSKLILVVEDDSDYRGLVVEILKEGGYSTLEANNGKEALEILSKNAVDIVLSDIKMPVMDGMELLKKIQALPENSPKVIMMSGYSVHTKEQTLQAGAEALVDKTSLLQQIVDLLSTIRFS